MLLLQNQDEDSELRIASYLQLMKCAGRDRLVDIVRMLNHEQVDQVL